MFIYASINGHKCLEMCSVYSKELFYLKNICHLTMRVSRKTEFCKARNFRLTFHPLKYYNSIRGIIVFKIYIYYNFYTFA
jgi:hypothetical protein